MRKDYNVDWEFLFFFTIQSRAVEAHLSQVEFEHIADVVGVKVGQLHQVLPVLKRLTQLLHPRLGAIHAVDPLQGTGDKIGRSKHDKMRRRKVP